MVVEINAMKCCQVEYSLFVSMTYLLTGKARTGMTLPFRHRPNRILFVGRLRWE